MNRPTGKPPAGDDAPAEATPSPVEVAQRGLGWSVTLSVWLLAFFVLTAYEAWNFLFPLVRRLFR